MQLVVYVLGRTSTLALGSLIVVIVLVVFFIVRGGDNGNETIFKLGCRFCLFDKNFDGSTVFFGMKMLEKSSCRSSLETRM
jgi:hypothetical protein